MWFPKKSSTLTPRCDGAVSALPVDAVSLHGYLCFSYVPRPLLASCPPKGEKNRGQETILAPNALRSLLRAAVQSRLEQSLAADGEVGVYLSGGLDSSLVAALLVEAGAKVRAFALDFGPPYDAELPHARAVAEHLRIPLHIVSARSADIAQHLEATAHALPLPFGDGVTTPLYLLGRTAKDFTNDVWNGEGGDQLFGGWANKPMIAALLYGEASPQNEVREYLATYHRFWGMTDTLYTPQQREKVGDVDEGAWVAPVLDYQSYITLLHRLRAANLQLKGAQNIVPRMVALAECHGLRVHSPLFDDALTAWTFTRPPDEFLAGACEKYVLKQVAQHYLPASLVWREKRGMGVPTTAWCLERGPVRRLVRAFLSPRALRAEERFEPAFVQRLLAGDDPTPEGAFRKRRVGEKLWLLLMWEVWRKVHGRT